MKLQEITLESYKSIENQKICLDYNCKGIIGLNESGKSNILYAIQHLDSNIDFTQSDKSKITNKLPKIKFHFSLSDTIIESIKRRIQHSLKPLIIDTKESIFKEFKLENLIVNVEMVEVDGKPRTDRTIDCSYSYKFSKDFYYLVDSEEISEEMVLTLNEKQYSLNEFHLFEPDQLPEEIIVKTLHSDDIQFESIFHEKMQKIVLGKLPDVVFWEYNDKYLLPSEITYEDFMKDDHPYENSAPLTNVFFINNRLKFESIDDLQERIVRWKADASPRLSTRGKHYYNTYQ